MDDGGNQFSLVQEDKRHRLERSRTGRDRGVNKQYYLKGRVGGNVG